MVIIMGLNLVYTRVLYQVELVDRMVYRCVEFLLAMAWCRDLSILTLEGQRKAC